MLVFHCCSRVHSADYYMQEAKRLKHKADALVRYSITLSAGTEKHTVTHTHTFTPPCSCTYRKQRESRQIHTDGKKMI